MKVDSSRPTRPTRRYIYSRLQRLRFLNIDELLLQFFTYLLPILGLGERSIKLFVTRLIRLLNLIIANMKIMISGASGVIGGEVLLQCLAHPKISSVIVFLRRNLPAEISNHPKIQCILIEDFSKWPQDVLREHSDAAGMIW